MQNLVIITPPTRLTKPGLRMAIGWVKEMQRMHPDWDLKACVRHGVNLAYEAINPYHKFWW